MDYPLGFRPVKKLSQNFAVDDALLQREVGYAAVKRSDTVLEIGAGSGSLTEHLVRAAGKVIAVEVDGRLAHMLRERFPAADVIEGDFLRLDVQPFNKVVSNLPYHISSKITMKLFEYEWELAVLCYQKEFAERFVARPGDSGYSRLTVAVNYFAEPEILEYVPRKSFWPVPKVDSALVRLVPRRRFCRVADETEFFKIVALLFQHKKQKVRNALLHSSAKLGMDRGEIARLLVGIPLAERKVFTLDIEDFAALHEALHRS